MAHRTVLLIDDEPEDRAELADLLINAGYDVVEVGDGRQALHYLTSDNIEPALIVTDLRMPDMSGWEFINILQSYMRLSCIPLLVVSGVNPLEQHLRDGAVAEFFLKPISPEPFVESVKKRARLTRVGQGSLPGSRFD